MFSMASASVEATVVMACSRLHILATGTGQISEEETTKHRLTRQNSARCSMALAMQPILFFISPPLIDGVSDTAYA